MKSLKQFLGNVTDFDALIFRSERGRPFLETTILSQGLLPTLRALGLPRAVSMPSVESAIGDGNVLARIRLCIVR
jgi:hypothetical protein